MFPLVFLVFFTNLNFKAQPKLPCFHLYSFCIFPVHSFVFNFKNFTNQNLHFFTPLRPPPLGALLPFFFPLFFGLFANPKPETSMHSFASNFKNFTNQNHHFFTPLRPPPLGGTAALFLPFIFLALLQTPNLKPQCILLHLTSRILQIRTHIFCHTTQGPPGGHCCNVFPLCFVFVSKP